MSDINIQIQRLKEMLAQEKRVLAEISDVHNHAEVRGRVEQFEGDLKKLEDWRTEQEKIRTQNQTAFDNGAPCGSA